MEAHFYLNSHRPSTINTVVPASNMTTAMGYTSTMHRVLAIPEMVELIFSFMDDDDNKVNACVCRRWSSIALDLVWREVDNINHLFGLLAPLEAVGPDPELSFNRNLSVDDWDRFARYARRIRTLAYVEAEETTPNSTWIAQNVFNEIGRSRPTFNILPGLSGLKWLAQSAHRLHLSLMFMHNNIKCFTVDLHQSLDYPLSTFCKDVVSRMPFLTYLELRYTCPVHDIESELVELFSNLPKLQKIILPLYSLTSRIVQALSLLPDIGTVQFEFMTPQSRGDPLDVITFAPRLSQGAFPALWDLSLSLNMSDMTRFLRDPYAPTHLTALYVHTISLAAPEEMHDLLNTISENCQLLTQLYIDFFMLPTFASISSSILYAEPLKFDDLRPILACPNMTTFELRWDQPLSITQDDIEELASKWPSLEVLMLNCEPVNITLAHHPTLTLRALLPFARYCPNLRELGLWLNACAADCEPRVCRPASFQCLDKLHVGLSSITEWGPVALYLSELLPLGCDVHCGVSWPEGFGVIDMGTNVEELDEIQRRATEWWDRWGEVSKALPLLTRLRLEERERTHELEKELNDLRMRCSVMEGNAGVELDGTCVAL